MSQTHSYASIAKRTFASAVIQLVETEYGFLGGRRVAQLLAEDLEQLVEEFYPAAQRVASGHLIWTCTKDEGKKAEPGKLTEDYPSVTVVLPLVAAEDLSARTHGHRPRSDRSGATRQRNMQQLVRVVKAAHAQGGLLTLAELSVILNHGYEQVRGYVRDWEAETGELLPLKGYHMDQGSKPTHKAAIIRLFEQGKEPPDIAHATQHALKSVERYLKDYERVRLLLQQGVPVEQLSSLVGRGQHVIQEYVRLVREYHPDLVPDASHHS